MNKIILSGILQSFNKPDSTGRIYPKEIYEKHIKKLELKILRENRLKKLNDIFNENN